MTDTSGAPPSAGAPQVDWRAAFKFGGSRFKDNAKPWVVCMAPLVLPMSLLVPGIFLDESIAAPSVVALGVATFCWHISALHLTQGALREVDGLTPAIRSFFEQVALRVRGTVMLLAVIAWIPIIVGNGVFMGTRGILSVATILLTFIVEIALLFLTFYTLTFALDQRLSPVEALRSSVRFTRTNFRQLAPFALVCSGVVIGGALLCGVGIIVAIPVVLIASTYVYRTLTHGPVLERVPNSCDLRIRDPLGGPSRPVLQRHCCPRSSEPEHNAEQPGLESDPD